MSPPDAGPAILFESAMAPGAAATFRLEVRPGEMALLTGPPGAGKSSVLRALAGYPARWPARALLAGRSLAALPHHRRRFRVRELRLGYVPEVPALISNISVMENLLLPARYLGELPEATAWREARALLDASGLGWAAGRLPGALPREDLRAVAVIRAMLRRPAVALLDEPLAGLDAASMTGVRSLLRATLGRGRCALLAAAADPAPYAGLHCRVLALPGEAAGPEA